MEIQTGGDIFTARTSQISDCSLKTLDRQKAKVKGHLYRRIHVMKRKREINYPGNKADPLCSTAKMANSEIMANKVEKI